MQIWMGADGELLAKSGQTRSQMLVRLDEPAAILAGSGMNCCRRNWRECAACCDLAVHLIAAHHGHGRPLIPHQDSTSIDVSVNLNGTAAQCQCRAKWAADLKKCFGECSRLTAIGVSHCFTESSCAPIITSALERVAMQVLTGLRADNLLGYLAALGVCRLTDCGLSWTKVGPVEVAALDTESSLDDLTDECWRRGAGCRPTLQIARTKLGSGRRGMGDRA